MEGNGRILAGGSGALRLRMPAKGSEVSPELMYVSIIVLENFLSLQVYSSGELPKSTVLENFLSLQFYSSGELSKSISSGEFF